MRAMKIKLSAMWHELIAAINSLIHGHTLDQIIEHEEHEARRIISEAYSVIRRHEYIRHMAKAKMNAIDDWNAGNKY